MSDPDPELVARVIQHLRNALRVAQHDDSYLVGVPLTIDEIRAAIAAYEAWKEKEKK